LANALFALIRANTAEDRVRARAMGYAALRAYGEVKP